jgi:protein-tyrosine phosphatase
MFIAERLVAHESAKSYGSKDASPEVADSTTKKADSVVSRSLAADLFKSILNSKVNLTAVGFSVLVVGGLIFACCASGFLPPAWMIIAVAVVSYVGAFPLLFALCEISKRAKLGIKFLQMSELEFAQLARLCKEKNWDIINMDDETNHIFLGALPNRSRSDGEYFESMGVRTVLSLNEEGELQNNGTSIPYQKEDWENLDITSHVIDKEDHTLLTIVELDKCAGIIKEGLGKGDVLVHCLGGKGRSAMAVAGYLMRFKGYSAEDARDYIKTRRKCSTIGNKMSVLKNYEMILATREGLPS